MLSNFSSHFLFILHCGLYLFLLLEELEKAIARQQSGRIDDLRAVPIGLFRDVPRRTGTRAHNPECVSNAKYVSEAQAEKEDFRT